MWVPHNEDSTIARLWLDIGSTLIRRRLDIWMDPNHAQNRQYKQIHNKLHVRTETRRMACRNRVGVVSNQCRINVETMSKPSRLHPQRTRVCWGPMPKTDPIRIGCMSTGIQMMPTYAPLCQEPAILPTHSQQRRSTIDDCVRIVHSNAHGSSF